METQQKKTVLIPVEISNENLTENIVKFYDGESKALMLEKFDSIPEEFYNELIKTLPTFSIKELDVTSPLFTAVNNLQKIKKMKASFSGTLALKGDETEEELKEIENKKLVFLEEERKVIDLNKYLGAYNSSLKEAKKIIKDPIIEKGKSIDAIFNLFSKEYENAKNYIEVEFSGMLSEKERIKKEAQDKKNQAIIDANKKLEEENAANLNQIKIAEKNAKVLSIENSISNWSINVVQNTYNYNEEALATLKSQVDLVDVNQFYKAEDKPFFEGFEDPTNSFDKKLKEQKEVIKIAINGRLNQLSLQKKDSVNKAAASLVSSGSPVFTSPVTTQPEPQPITQTESETKPESQTEIGLGNDKVSDLDAYKHFAQIQNNFTIDFDSFIKQFESHNFDLKELNELKNKIIEQNKILLDNMVKINNFVSRKTEILEKHLSTNV